LADKANKQGFGPDYQLAASNYSTMEGHNESFEIWVNSSKPKPMDVEEVESDAQSVKNIKFMQNGQLFIRCGGHVFDATGRRVK
jgi:hypothetical protein